MTNMKSGVGKCIEEERKYVLAQCGEHRDLETQGRWEIKEFILEVVKRSKV